MTRSNVRTFGLVTLCLFASVACSDNSRSSVGSTGGISGFDGSTNTGESSADLGGTVAVTAAASSFRCGNWADLRDNFVDGNLLLSGIANTDNYDSVVAKGTAILSAFQTTVGANSIRVPINEPTVAGTYWSTYKGTIDAGINKGMKVIIAYWAHQNGKEDDRTAYFAMWKAVVDAYLDSDLVYFEPFNEPWFYTASDWTDLAAQWVATYPNVPRGRIIIAGSWSDNDVRQQGADPRLDGTLLSLHIYPFTNATMTDTSGWTSLLQTDLGSYASRTIVTEWGAPMTTGIDYSGAGEGDHNGSFISAISTYLHDNAIGSCYWPVLRTADSWSLSTMSGVGTDATLTITNASGLARVQSAFGL
jgi:endoglucanase